MEKIGNVSTTTTTGSTPGYIDANVGPRPCPSCGHCPTCGRGGYNTPYQPWWQQVPYYQPTYTYGTGTTSGNIVVAGGASDGVR